MSRPSWDSYFMSLARVVATRATCHKGTTGVGSVIVSPEHHILVTGYNGSLPGGPHCDDIGHELEDGHCVRTVHAEANAIAQAARHGISVQGAVCYTTLLPCYTCLKLLVAAGIREVVFQDIYRHRNAEERVIRVCSETGIVVRRLSL